MPAADTLTVAPSQPTAESSGVVAIKTLLLTDLVDSTRMLERMGDERASEVSARHDRLARELLADFGAQEIDKSDGFLLLFDRPIDAVRFALAYHGRLAALSDEVGTALSARCGIHLGEVFLRQNPAEEVARGAKPLEVEGLAKPAAARLMSLAGGRQTLLTRGAFDLARRAAVGGDLAGRDLHWLAHGPYLFKGVDEPQDIFEVGVVGLAPLEVPPDSEKARRAVAPGDEIALGWRPAPGQAVPRRDGWKLKEKLGEGGFGEVWLAAHDRTHLKRVFKFCYEADRLRALKREVTLFRLLRETLGHRDDIARILDWDFEEAPYLLELDHTEGGSLVEWAEEQGGIAEVPLNTRLELVAQVADALAAAHSVGVLHKDVKPNNVLITTGRDGQPRAVLTDFGVGMVTDQDLLAAKGITTLGMSGMTLASSASAGGTQMYTAPELLAGAVATVHADIYALGVMLYQMAVGDLDRPLAPGWRREIADDVLADDIADIADGSPGRRVGTAGEVAERVRSLSERRVRRADEERQRLETERASRRRRLLGLVSAVSTVFLIGVSFFAYQAVQARQEAERRQEQAEGLIDFMLVDLRDGLETIGRLDLLEAVARQSRSYFESLPEGERDAAAAERGLSLLNIGDVLIEQGDTVEAADAYERAEGLYAGLVAEAPSDVEVQLGLARSWSRMGDALRRQGETAEADVLFRSALSAIEQLVADHPEDPAVHGELARAHLKVARMDYLNGQGEAALGGCREALAAAGRAVRSDPQASWRWVLLTIEIHILTGDALVGLNRLDEALVAYGAALGLAEEQVENYPVQAIWRQQLAWIHYQTGVTHDLRPDAIAEAMASFRAALSAYEDFVTWDPTGIVWKAGAGQSKVRIGRLVGQSGRPEQAIIMFTEARQLFEDLVEKDPTRLIWSSWICESAEELGKLYLRQEQPEQALEAMLAANRIRAQLAERDAEDLQLQNRLSWNHVLIGYAYTALGEAERAADQWRASLDLIEPVTARSDRSDYLDTHVHALLHLKDVEAARPLVEELLRRGWSYPSFLELLHANGLAENG